MTAAVQAMIEQAQRLSAEEREELAEALLAELHADDDIELTPEWNAEIARRDEEVLAGGGGSHSLDEAMAAADRVLSDRKRASR